MRIPVAQNLDGGEGPERVVVLPAEVTTMAGGGVLNPDLGVGRTCWCHSDQGLSRRGERLSRWCAASRVEQCSGVLAAFVDGADQGRQDR